MSMYGCATRIPLSVSLKQVTDVIQTPPIAAKPSSQILTVIAEEQRKVPRWILGPHQHTECKDRFRINIQYHLQKAVNNLIKL